VSDSFFFNWSLSYTIYFTHISMFVNSISYSERPNFIENE